MKAHQFQFLHLSGAQALFSPYGLPIPKSVSIPNNLDLLDWEGNFVQDSLVIYP
jgi:hypothetical protein